MTFLLADTLLKAQLMSRDRQQKDWENNSGCLHPSILGRRAYAAACFVQAQPPRVNTIWHPHGNQELTCCFHTAFQEASLQPCMGSLLLF